MLVSFAAGFGTTAAGVGILIALGAMFAKLLADSGGADQIVDTIVGHASPRMLPWAMALVGAIIGLPMFFEIGLVLLMPVIYLVARRSQLSLITVGIPALAGLSAMHGLVPPHPGPLIAIDTLGAYLGYDARARCPGRGADRDRLRSALRAARRQVGRRTGAAHVRRHPGGRRTPGARRSGSPCSRCCCRSALMMGKALADILIDDETQPLRRVLDLIGEPLFALLISLVVAMFTLGRGSGMGRARGLEGHGDRRCRRSPASC